MNIPTTTIKPPHFYAWKNAKSGSGAKPTLHIIGSVYATICQEPYLEPLKGGAPLFFEVKYKDISKPGQQCPAVELPRNIDPYSQQYNGDGAEVTIKVGGQTVTVPIDTIS